MVSINRVIELMSIEQECVSRDCDRNCAACDLVQEQHELIEAYSSVIELLYNIGFLLGDISQRSNKRYSYYIHTVICYSYGIKPMSRIKFLLWYAKNHTSADREYSKLLEKLGVVNE